MGLVRWAANQQQACAPTHTTGRFQHSELQQQDSSLLEQFARMPADVLERIAAEADLLSPAAAMTIPGANEHRLCTPLASPTHVPDEISENAFLSAFS